jgi:hypothetical protein
MVVNVCKYMMQCRQKTVEAKAKCGSCTMFFCPRCLLNRYGEEVDKVHHYNTPDFTTQSTTPPCGSRADTGLCLQHECLEHNCHSIVWAVAGAQIQL